MILFKMFYFTQQLTPEEKHGIDQRRKQNKICAKRSREKKKAEHQSEQEVS